MIKEAYVSFEVAKLLKEKGFDATCEMFYCNPYEGYLKNQHCDEWRNSDLREDMICTCPTLYMAMCWLREVHNLSVEVYRTACGYIGCIVTIPSGTDIKFLEEDGDDLPSGQYTTWEKACEAAIKECLENII